MPKEDTPDNELELVREAKPHRRASDPTNIYGFLLKIGEKWGFPALVAIAAAFMVWKLVNWQRADSKIFVEAVQSNTKAIESLATEQRVMNVNLVKHLEHDERRPH